MRTGQPVINREEYIFDQKGEKRWLLTSKLPLRDKEGRTIGLVGIGHDITERKQAEDQLRKLSLAVEQSPTSIVITDTGETLNMSIRNSRRLRAIQWKKPAEKILAF